MISPKRILLVEDSPSDAELTLHALAELAEHRLADQVLHLHDGAQALDYLFVRGEFSGRPRGNPAVVLLDLKMPKVDGIEVLRRIRAEPGLAMIPVVIMTSSREERDIEAAYGLGANAYVVKAMKFANFVSAIQQVGMFWAVVNQPPLAGPSSQEEHRA